MLPLLPCPAAELAHGQAAGNAGMWHPGGIRAHGCCALTSIPVERWAERCHPTITAASYPQHLAAAHISLAVRCDTATLVPPHFACKGEGAMGNQAEPCHPSRAAHPGSLQARGGAGQQREEQSGSKREGGGLQEEMEPTANWAVVCVVWRLLLTTRYN